MMNFSNPAYRVLNYIQVVRKIRDEKLTASQAWARAFNLDEDRAKTDFSEINHKLVLLHRELDLCEVKMAETGFSENLYKPYFKQIGQCISPPNISAPWVKNYMGRLQSDTILSLMFCAEILESEPEADFEELEKLLSDLDKFKQTLEQGNISKPTHDFVLEQIEIIERAISEYQIRGSRAIRDGFVDGFNNVAQNYDNLAEDESPAFMSKVKEHWNRLEVAGGVIIKADRIASSYAGLWAKGRSLGETLTNFLPPP